MHIKLHRIIPDVALDARVSSASAGEVLVELAAADRPTDDRVDGSRRIYAYLYGDAAGLRISMKP